jgi:peroxiredoxin family protein
MVNYSKGKIYKIEPIIEHDECDIYIGSTTKEYLSQRMDTHRTGYKNWNAGKYGFTSSYTLFEKYGVENCNILLIKQFSCNSNDELKAEEGRLIRCMKCVNIRIPCRTSKEQKVLYTEMNKQKIKENKQRYYQENKNIIEEKQSKIYECECGSKIRNDSKRKHCISKVHLNYLNSLESK